MVTLKIICIIFITLSLFEAFIISHLYIKLNEYKKKVK